MISLRTAMPSDRAFLLRVFASSRTDLALLPSQLVELQFAAQDAAYARARRSVVVVDGIDAGRLYVQGEHVVDITLLPEFRGRGIGTALLEGLMDERVSLNVSVLNPARALYERLGFRVVSDDGAYLSMVWTPRTVSCSLAAS